MNADTPEWEKRRDEIRRLYLDEGLSYRAIGARLSPPTSGKSIGKILAKMGVQARPVGARSPRTRAEHAIEVAARLESMAKAHRKEATRLRRPRRKAKGARRG